MNSIIGEWSVAIYVCIFLLLLEIAGNNSDLITYICDEYVVKDVIAMKLLSYKLC